MGTGSIDFDGIGFSYMLETRVYLQGYQRSQSVLQFGCGAHFWLLPKQGGVTKTVDRLTWLYMRTYFFPSKAGHWNSAVQHSGCKGHMHCLPCSIW